MAYDDTNRGALFKNDKKQHDNQPDYTGKINVNGTEMWISAWLKTAESGRKYMSLSVQQKDAQSPTPAPQAQQRHGDRPGARPAAKTGTGFDAMDDDLPPF